MIHGGGVYSIIVFWNHFEIIESANITSTKVGQDAQIKSEDFPVRTSFEDFNFLLPFRGECEADFSR